jgi:transcription-repair coupling factor (superfamily II helicase)
MNTHSLLSPPLPRAGQQRAWWQQPASASAQALALIGAAQQHSGLLLVVVRDTHGAHTLEQDLRVFASELPVLHFPDWETLPYDQFSPHPDIISQRIAALYRLPSVQRGVLVVPASTLMQRLPPTRFIGGNALMVRKGQRLDMDAEKRRLEAAGYRNVGQVLDPGDFAVRGALLDVYAMGADAPYRIELFDDEVESIRSFDPESQRSQHPVEEVSLLPAREFPLDDAACNAVRRRLSERFDIDPRRCPLYQDLKQGDTPAGIEYYLPAPRRFSTISVTTRWRLSPATHLLPPTASGRKPPSVTNSAVTIWSGRCCRQTNCIWRPMPCARGSMPWLASNGARPGIHVMAKPIVWANNRRQTCHWRRRASRPPR